MSEALLEVDGLHVGYLDAAGRPVSIVRGVDLILDRGASLGFVGESGCGKSTLLLSLMHWFAPGLGRLDGTIRYSGQDPAALRAAALQRLRGGSMALIPQNAGQALTPTLRIGSQLIEALTLHAETAPGERVARAIELLDRVRLPDPAALMRRYPHELSGGQQQRVALAMALAGEPDLLLLDEPTTGLDVTTQQYVLELLKEVAAEAGTAMVFVSHDIDVIGSVCDEVAVMYAGEIVEQGPREAVLEAPQHPYTRGLLASIPRLHMHRLPEPIEGSLAEPAERESAPGCVFLGRCAFAVDACGESKPPLVATGGARRVRCLNLDGVGRRVTPAIEPPARGVSTGAGLLEARDLAVSYERPGLFDRFTGRVPKPTVEGVSFSLERGRTLALVGESGSGKSTILRALAGLLPVAAGSVTLDGDDLAIPVSARSRDVLRRLQLVFQNPDASLNPRHTVAQSLRRPLDLYFDLDGAALDAEAERLLASVNLPRARLPSYPGQLSGGEKQRVAIARALAAQPDIMLCDEITSALDVSVQAAVLRLLTELAAAHNLALVFVSHDLAVVETLADDVIVLQDGEVREAGPVNEVFSDPQHAYTRRLLDAVL